MTFDYVASAADALDLLTEFGAQVTLRNVDPGAYVPGSGTVTAAANVDATRMGVLLDFAAGQTLGPGGLIQQSDKRLLLAPGVVPALEDRLVANGVEYTIKGIGEINPAGVPVLYDLHLRT